MPIQLEVKRKLCIRTDRVKCVQFHPTESWILSSLYSGCAQLYNYETQVNVKTFEVASVPIRAGIFVVRKSWVVFGSDDMFVRVFNYNTMEKVKEFEAHSDYLRSIVAHPGQPLLLTSSDDMTIKMWDWEQKWVLKQTFEGHIHYVMQIELNPKDLSTFASASMDRTIKVWHLGSTQANFTLEGHQRGVNCVSYFGSGGDKPYLLSGGDDNVVKIWDYQNKSCVHTINAHHQNINFVACHSTLPLIVSGSEDGTVKYWNSSTYKMESMLNYGLERCWTGSVKLGGNEIAVGYDLGTVVVQMGREKPAASMDPGGSKVVWAKHNVIQYATTSGVGLSMPDGARVPISVKELGSCEVYPTSLSHSPNGRFIAVCGDGEYIIYTALALRSKAYGSAQDFVWSHDPAYFATRQGNEVKIHKSFKDVSTIRVDPSAYALYGGRLLGVQSKDEIAFYDWTAPDNVVCRVEIAARLVIWSDNGRRVAIASADDNCFFLLDVADVDDNAQSDDLEIMKMSKEVAECVTSGLWYNTEVFIYTTTANKLNYCIDGHSMTIAHLDKITFILHASRYPERTSIPFKFTAKN